MNGHFLLFVVVDMYACFCLRTHNNYHHLFSFSNSSLFCSTINNLHYLFNNHFGSTLGLPVSRSCLGCALDTANCALSLVVLCHHQLCSLWSCSVTTISVSLWLCFVTAISVSLWLRSVAAISVSLGCAVSPPSSPLSSRLFLSTR